MNKKIRTKMSRILKDDIGDDDDFRNDFQDEAEFDDDQYASNKNNNNNDDDDAADGRHHASQLVVNLVDAAQVKKGGALRGAARETTSSQATQTKKNHGKKTTMASRESLDACAKVQQTEIAKMRETLQERFTGERVEGAALVFKQCNTSKLIKAFLCQWAMLWSLQRAARRRRPALRPSAC